MNMSGRKTNYYNQQVSIQYVVRIAYCDPRQALHAAIDLCGHFGFTDGSQIELLESHKYKFTSSSHLECNQWAMLTSWMSVEELLSNLSILISTFAANLSMACVRSLKAGSL